MTAQELYDSLDRKQRRDLLLKVGETREEAQVLSQRDEFQIGREKNVRRRTGQLESLANNRPFLDGNKRVAFAAAHTFLLINGFDLAVDSLAAYEFIVRSISTNEFGFAQILQWIDAHIVEA